MTPRPDILLAGSHFLCQDPAEQRIMKPYPPLGVLYLSSFLKQRGFRVEVFDGTFATLADFERVLDDLKPHTVGISCNMGTKFNTLRMIRQVRSRGIMTVLGGPEPANYAREYLDSGADCIVLGEGERTLEQLLQLIREAGLGPAKGLLDKEGGIGIPGIVYLAHSRKVVATPSREPIDKLSDLPWPDREAVDLRRYMSAWRGSHGYASLSVICARGCPHACTWCSHSVFGRTHRRRDVSEVADEIEHIRDAYNPDALWFADDVFNIDHNWLYEFRDEMVRRRLVMPFECLCRADGMNQPVASALKDLQCRRVWIGAESGSQRILDAMQRGLKIEQVRQAARLARSAGMEVGTFIMLGYDGEELEDIEATIDHLQGMAPDIVLTTIAYPIKGTQYYDSVSARITAGAPWPVRTDRDLCVRGRYPREFYELAKRWVNSEVQLRCLRRDPGPQAKRAMETARAYLRARWYRHQTRRLRSVRSQAADFGPLGASPGTEVAECSRDCRRTSPTGLASPFDSAAASYDERFTYTALGRWLRQRVWERLAENLPADPPPRILELGGGTGEDLCWLARRGAAVTCTDGSPRMLEMAASKVAACGLDAKVTIAQLDLNHLPTHLEPASPFDVVLSNFGAINCVAHRRDLAAWIAQRTRPGAYIVLTVMGPFCPWEIAVLAATRPADCLRRWRRKGVDFSPGSNGSVRVFYPSPARLNAEFSPWFERVRLSGLGVLLPPTQWSSLVQRRPRLLAALGWVEQRVAGYWPATWLNDHYVLELRRRR